MNEETWIRWLLRMLTKPFLLVIFFYGAAFLSWLFNSDEWAYLLMTGVGAALMLSSVSGDLRELERRREASRLGKRFGQDKEEPS